MSGESIPHCGNCGKDWTTDADGRWQAPCDCAGAWESPAKAMRELDALERKATEALEGIISIARDLRADVEAHVEADVDARERHRNRKLLPKK